MADEKIYKPQVIEDQPFPQEDAELFFDSDKSTKDIIKPDKIKANSFPLRKVAHEVLGSALNTRSQRILKEFKFTQSGAIQIGQYVNGISGDIKITENGIVARNKDGLITLSIDGTNGDAIFRGQIQSGSLVTGLVAVGDNSVVIDGEGKRIVIYDDAGIPKILIGYQEGGF